MSQLRLAGPTLLVLVVGCSAGAPTVTTLRHFPVDNLDGVLTQSGVAFDQTVSSDGNGALRIDATEPVSVRLYEVEGPTADDAVLTYRAKVRVENVQGQAYIEMWCQVSGVGEAFSRALQAPLTGTVDWTTQETPFFLERDQACDLVKLNVVVDGTGTVWIDDIALLQAKR